jgi:hypothetical protein
MRRFPFLLAAAATCVALGLPTAAGAAPPPAGATSASVTPHGGGFSVTICFPVFVNPPGITVWQCHTIQIPQEKVAPPGGGCPPCGEATDFTYDPEEFKNQQVLVDDLAQGYGLLGQAAVSTQKDAAALHAKAVDSFIAAARALGTTTPGVRQVGYVDPAGATFNPSPVPWRQQIGADQQKALTNLQAYLAKGNAKNLTTATAALDDSYQTLATHAATQTVG